MLEVMRSLYEHAYEGLDRDVGLEIAEESNKSQTRVPGIGWFYGELSWSGSWDLIGLAKPRIQRSLIWPWPQIAARLKRGHYPGLTVRPNIIN